MAENELFFFCFVSSSWSVPCSNSNGAEYICLTYDLIKRTASILRQNSTPKGRYLYNIEKWAVPAAINHCRFCLVFFCFLLNVEALMCLRVCVCVCGHHCNVSSCLSGPGGQRSSTEELERNSHRPAGHPHHLFPDCHLRYPADPKYVHTTPHKRKHTPVGCAVHTKQRSPSVYLDHSALWHLCVPFLQNHKE